MTLLESALEYKNRFGFSLIPFRNDKSAPFIKSWDEFQRRKPTDEEIREWWTKWPNAMIAAVTGKISNLILIDFDTYKLKSDKIKKIVNDLIPHTVPGPIASTPQGGFHRPFFYMDGVGCLKNIPLCIDIKGEGGLMFLSPSANGNGRSYVWQPGRGPHQAPLGNIDINIYNNIIIAFNKYKDTSEAGGKTESISVSTVSKRSIGFNEGARNESLFHIAWTMVKGGMEEDNLFKILKPIANSCLPPLDDSDIDKIIKSVFDRGGKKDVKVLDEVKAFVADSNGFFSVTDALQGVSTVPNRVSIRVALHRLVKDMVLEKHPTREGLFRKLNNRLIEMDIVNADITPIAIKWPFQMESFVKMLKKTVVIVAGVTNAGKSGYLLNVAKLNRHDHDIRWLSSEMGPEEMKERLLNFNVKLTDWGRVKFYQRGRDFHEVILPNGINIIDYLEVHEDFAKIGDMISKIYDSLETGIAIISIQKKFDKELGRGAEFSMEKSRLYMTIDPLETPYHSKIKIIKAKQKTDPKINPMFMELDFSFDLFGCSMKAETNWHSAYLDKKGAKYNKPPAVKNEGMYYSGEEQPFNNQF